MSDRFNISFSGPPLSIPKSGSGESISNSPLPSLILGLGTLTACCCCLYHRFRSRRGSCFRRRCSSRCCRTCSASYLSCLCSYFQICWFYCRRRNRIASNQIGLTRCPALVDRSRIVQTDLIRTGRTDPTRRSRTVRIGFRSGLNRKCPHPTLSLMPGTGSTLFSSLLPPWLFDFRVGRAARHPSRFETRSRPPTFSDGIAVM